MKVITEVILDNKKSFNSRFLLTSEEEIIEDDVLLFDMNGPGRTESRRS